MNSLFAGIIRQFHPIFPTQVTHAFAIHTLNLGAFGIRGDVAEEEVDQHADLRFHFYCVIYVS